MDLDPFNSLYYEQSSASAGIMTSVHANMNKNKKGGDAVTINDSSSQLVSTQLQAPGLTVEEHQANHICSSAVHDAALAAMADFDDADLAWLL
jgi:hypothetical protein